MRLMAWTRTHLESAVHFLMALQEQPFLQSLQDASST